MLARATLREFTENALEPDPRPELVDRILVHRERTAQRFEPWAAQAAAGATFDAHDRLGSLADADARAARRRRCRRRSAQRDLLARGDSRRAALGLRRVRPVFMWQEPERFVAELEEFLC